MKPRLYLPGEIWHGQPREWLVSELIELGTTTLLIGPEKSGKSALGAEVACCIVAGRPFLGRTVRAGAVVYAASERTVEVSRRISAGLNTFESTPPVRITGDVRHLIDEQHAVEFAAACREFVQMEQVPLRLIVIDTLAAAMGDSDENSSPEMSRLCRNLDLLRAQTGAAILVVHHAKREHMRQAQRARGSQVLEAYADLTLVAQQRAKERWLEVSKANTISVGQRLGFSLRIIPQGTDPETHAPSSVVLAGPPDEQGASLGSGAPKLSPDCMTVWTCAQQVCTGGMVDLETLRSQVYAQWPNRKPTAKRVAFNKSKSRLIEAGYLSFENGTVSVSDV